MPKNKEIKKKKFIEKSGFEKLLSGEQIESIEADKFIPDKNNESPYSMINVPRIGLSRLTNHQGENYFHFGEIIYRENAGLSFLYEIKDKNIESQFQTTLTLLADEGIGGDRSSGKGLFNQPAFSDITLNTPENAPGLITLSLYSPAHNELDNIDRAYYQLLSRSGYIYSPYCQSLRRKSVRMFTEGSVFSGKKTGKLADITPQIFKEHKVYRYGFAFTLPCVLEVKNED